jgi:hypothetical protein
VQAQEEQSLRQGQEIELASDQALVGQFPPDSSQYQFYQQQISLLDLELGNEAGALEAAQNAENAGTAQEQFIVQSEQGLHPPLPYNPASGPPVPQPSLLQAQEALGQQPTLQALQAALNAPVQLQAEQQQYYNYLRQVASGLGGVPASTVGAASGTNPTNAGFGGVAGSLDTGFNATLNLGPEGAITIPYGSALGGFGPPPGLGIGSIGGGATGSFDLLETGVPNVMEFSGPPLADALQGLATTDLGLSAPPDIGAAPLDLTTLYDPGNGLPYPTTFGPFSPDYLPPPVFSSPDFGGLPPELSNPAQIPYIAAPNAPVPQDLAVTGQQGIGLGPLGNFGTAPEPPDFPTLAAQSGLGGNFPQVSPANFFDTALQGLIPFEQAQPFLQAPQEFGLAQSADVVSPDIIQRPSDEAPPTWNIPFTKAEEGIQKTGTTTTIADAVEKLTGAPLSFTQKLALGDAANASIDLTKPLVQQLNAIGAGDHVNEILEALQPIGTPEEIQQAAIKANLPMNYFPSGAGTPYLSGTTIEEALSGTLPPVTASDIAAAVSDFESTFAQMRPSAAEISAALTNFENALAQIQAPAAVQLPEITPSEISAAVANFESTFAQMFGGAPEAPVATLAAFQGGPWAGAPQPPTIVDQLNAPATPVHGNGQYPISQQYLNDPRLIGQLAWQAYQTGVDPQAMAAVISEESGWNPRVNAPGSDFIGLYQVGRRWNPELYAGVNANINDPLYQLQSYGQYLGGFGGGINNTEVRGINSALANYGISLNNYDLGTQSAILQAYQLAPGGTWMAALSNGNLDFPILGPAAERVQAQNLGRPLTLRSMTNMSSNGWNRTL